MSSGDALLSAIINSMDDGILEITHIMNDQNEVIDFSSKVINKQLLNHTGLKEDQLNIESLNKDLPEYREFGRVEKFCNILETGKTYRSEPSS